jgi:hypothetical protein
LAYRIVVLLPPDGLDEGAGVIKIGHHGILTVNEIFFVSLIGSEGQGESDDVTLH